MQPLCESQRSRGHFSEKKWESEMHKSWSLPAEGFEIHVATDGILLVAGKWRTEHVVGQWCSWIMMKNRSPAHHQEGGADGFLLSSKTVVGPSKCMPTTKELLMGCGEEKESA